VSAQTAIRIENSHVMREIVGELGAHLQWVREALGIEVHQRGDTITFTSDDGSGELAAQLFSQLAELAGDGRRVRMSDVRHGLRILRGDPQADIAAWFREAIILDVRRRPITARSINQRAYVDTLRAFDVVFGVGPAGTGKTYLAMAMAVKALKNGDAKRIVLTRPAVEAGEKLGFLPGDLTEKVDPYLRPLFDALSDMLPEDEIARLLERRTIEVAPLAFMRGRTLSEAFVVLDEAQNTTVEQMRMFLTRLGNRGRMVITGDPSQVDLPSGRPSGLAHALRILEPVEAVGVVRFSSEDVVRHPLVAAIINAYEKDDKVRAERRAQREAERRR
jgi:phosphate starvation-inducible PhoH-like protein